EQTANGDIEPMRFGWLLIGVLIFTCSAGGESNAPLLMPVPAHVVASPGSGVFALQQAPRLEFRGVTDARVQHAAERFLANLARRTNVTPAGAGQGAPSFVITCNNEGEKVQTLGEDESYRLEVTPTEVHLDAPTPLGVIHGLQTFLQVTEKGPDG